MTYKNLIESNWKVLLKCRRDFKVYCLSSHCQSVTKYKKNRKRWFSSIFYWQKSYKFELLTNTCVLNICIYNIGNKLRIIRVCKMLKSGYTNLTIYRQNINNCFHCAALWKLYNAFIVIHLLFIFYIIIFGLNGGAVLAILTILNVCVC